MKIFRYRGYLWYLLSAALDYGGGVFKDVISAHQDGKYNEQGDHITDCRVGSEDHSY